ncbi:MAG: hypothetical protein E6J34_14615, partial [Chloroflexi bacterium]
MRNEIKVRMFSASHLLMILVSVMSLLAACGQSVPSGNATTVTPKPALRTPQIIYAVDANKQLRAFRHDDGKVLWLQQTSSQGRDEGVLTVENLVVYVVQSNETSSIVTAFDAKQGKLLWSTQVPLPRDSSGYRRSVAVKVTGHFLVAEIEDGQTGSPTQVYALRTDSKALLWQVELKQRCCRGFLATKESVAIASVDELDVLQTSTGQRLWQYQPNTNNNHAESYVMGIASQGGTIYLSAGGFDQSQTPNLRYGYTVALQSGNGQTLWTHSVTGFTPQILASSEEMILVGAFWDRTLEALRSTDGMLLWQYKDSVQSDRGFVAATVADHIVYVTAVTVGYADNGSTLDALHPNDGTRLWRYEQSTGGIELIAASPDTCYIHARRDEASSGIAALRFSDRKELWFSAV